MKRVLRIASALLALLFLLLTASCGGADTPSDTTALGDDDTTTAQFPVSEVRETVPSGLPAALDFDGRPVTFLTREHTTSDGKQTGHAANEITVTDLNSDPVNDAIYNRKIAVEDQLNVTIREMEVSDSGRAINDAVRKDIASMNGDYDIICGSVSYNTPLIYEGCCFNLLSNGIEEYVDISKPWWSHYWIDEVRMGDRLYCITGSLALTLKRQLFVTYYNKTLAETMGLENMYEVVDEGRWTIDYLAETAKSLYRDLNGNSERDSEDQYGYMTNHYANADVYWSSCDMQFLRHSDDGWFEVASDQEKISTVFEKAFSLVYENPGTYDFIDSYGWNTAEMMFSSGSVVFATMYLEYAEHESFRGMDDDYGILPEPKFDEKQKEYYTFSHDQYTVFMIPVSCTDLEAAAATLEAMGCESYNNVEVAYYDTALKGKYSNDPETRQMLDIIVNGFKVDAAFVYGSMLGEPAAECFRCLIYEGNRTFASTYAKYVRSSGLGVKALKSKIEEFDY